MGVERGGKSYEKIPSIFTKLSVYSRKGPSKYTELSVCHRKVLKYTLNIFTEIISFYTGTYQQ